MSGNSTEGAGETSNSGCRVAFFGGSFDPPHLGHLAVARAALIALHLDTVLFAPVGTQPLKPQGATAAFDDRVAMTRLAIAGDRSFALSLIDAPGPGGKPDFAPNFTIDTLHRLRDQLPPNSSLFCLMGADSFLALRSWHRAAEIPFAAPLIVASRPGQSLADLEIALPPGLVMEPAPQEDKIVAGVTVRGFSVVNPAGDRAPLYLLPGLEVEISASAIRRKIQTQLRAATGTRGLMPEPVADYVRSHGLYR